jgi:plastocyanin
MHKKWLLFMAMLAFLSLGFAACSIKDSSQAAANAVEVDMGGANFIQSSVTLKQGQQINLVDKASSTHIIVNGSWINGKQVPKQEPGAPTINMTFTGNDSALTPPWNTPGTYHLYCTIHVGMNLTVIVKPA